MSYVPVPTNIASIAKAVPAVVTTSSAHGLLTGEKIRTIVPKNYGMTEINNKIYIIKKIDSTSFSLHYSLFPNQDVDSRDFTTFTIPVGRQRRVAAIVPIGSGPSEDPVGSGIYIDKIDDQLVNIET